MFIFQFYNLKFDGFIDYDTPKKNRQNPVKYTYRKNYSVFPCFFIVKKYNVGLKDVYKQFTASISLFFNYVKHKTLVRRKYKKKTLYFFGKKKQGENTVFFRVKKQG